MNLSESFSSEAAPTLGWRGGRRGLRKYRLGWQGVVAAMIMGLTVGSPIAQGAAGNLVISPESGVNVSGLYLGPFGTHSQVYALSNAGVDSISWIVTKDRAWISFLSLNSGSLEGGAVAEVEILVNSKVVAAPATNDVGTLTFFNQTEVATDTRQVTLNVGLAGPGTASVQSVLVSNQYQITITGEPGTTNVLEDAADVGGPWTPVETNVFAGLEATYDFSVSGPSSRYFRTASSGLNAVAATLTVAKVQRLDNSLVEVTGDPNGVYVVEASTNSMVSWIRVYTNKISASGSFVFTNTFYPEAEQVDYRVFAVGNLDLPVLDHILIVGESLAVGLDGNPALSVTPVGNNFKFRADTSGTYLTRLIESGLETIASGAANTVTSLAPLENILMSNIGKNFAVVTNQTKGTVLYDQGIEQFRAAPQAVAYRLFRHSPSAIFAVGGEGDYRNTNFASNIRQWQTDYQKDIQLLTGFTGVIPMFHSQFSAWTSPYSGGFETVSGSPFELLKESEANPTKTVLVCPRYFLPYASAGLFPGLSLSNEGYRWLGEYYGKVYKKVAVDGSGWTPLKPNTITRTGTTISVLFDVPAPPLVLDTDLVTDPGNYGFEFHDESGATPTIVSVNVTGPDTVDIELSSEPTGGGERLRYAYRGVSGNGGGPTTGPRGNLRDSDATPSLYDNPLYNWCVHFDKPVN